LFPPEGVPKEDIEGFIAQMFGMVNPETEEFRREDLAMFLLSIGMKDDEMTSAQDLAMFLERAGMYIPIEEIEKLIDTID